MGTNRDMLRFHDLFKRLRELEKRVAELEAKELSHSAQPVAVRTDVECPGGCEFPSMYLSPDGRVPCMKCGRTIPTGVTYTVMG